MNPIQLGPFQIEHPFILAPMAGITNSPFRRLMKRRKSAMVISELVSANGIEHASERTLKLLEFHDEERVVGLQIFGEHTDLLCKASQIVERMGADFVDLNLGCPVPKIVKRGAGSAMCRNPVELGKTLEAMVKSVKIPVTIKIRTGWDAESINAHEIVKIAADVGIRWVAIHGRTRAQGYSGEANWDLIGEIKARSRIPIIGNGDLNTPEVAVERFKKYGVDAVMVGRGALRNPFFFEQAYALWCGEHYREPGAEDIIAILDHQRQLLSEVYNAHYSMIHARKFVSWYSAGYPGSSEFRKKVFTIPEPDALWDEAKQFFGTSAGLRTQQFLAQPFLMGGHG